MVVVSLHPIGGMFPSKKSNPIYKGIPLYKNTSSNNADNLMYTLEFQAKHYYPTNLSSLAISPKIQRYTIDIKQECGILESPYTKGVYLNSTDILPNYMTIYPYRIPKLIGHYHCIQMGYE